MLTFTTEERDGHVVLRAEDEAVLIDGKPYSDWTVINHVMTTRTMMDVYLEHATQRLKNRYERFLRSGGMPPITPGRRLVGLVGEFHTNLAEIMDEPQGMRRFG